MRAVEAYNATTGPSPGPNFQDLKIHPSPEAGPMRPAVRVLAIHFKRGAGLPRGAGIHAMIAQPNLPAKLPDLAAALDGIIDEHGSWRVLRALLAAALKRRRLRVTASDMLNAHMRRDIGLDPLPPERPRLWELR